MSAVSDQVVSERGRKISVEEVLAWERDLLIDALGCELELNDSFLSLYCGEDIKRVLGSIPESLRGCALHSCEISASWVGGYVSNNPRAILLPVPEIEFQFGGEPSEVFEDLSDWYISEGSDLAYYYVGVGLQVCVDLDQLKQAVREVQNE